MNYPNQNNPNPFGNVMGSYPVQNPGYGQPQPQMPYGQPATPYGQQQAMPGQYQQPQPPLQGFQQQQQSNYPQWFAQVTGVDPVYMDQAIIQAVSGMVQRIIQSGLGQRINYHPSTQQTLAQSPEIQQLIPLVRQSAIIFLLGGRGIQLPQAIQKATETVLLGDAVHRMGGPFATDIQQWDMVIGTPLAPYHTNYMSIAGNPQMYQSVIQSVAQRLMQQAAPMGGYGGISSANVNPNAIPNAAFGYTQALVPPQQQQAPTDPLSMIGRVAASGQNPQTASTIDLYSLANATNRKPTAMGQAFAHAQHEPVKQPTQSAGPATQPVVIPDLNENVSVTRVSGGERSTIDPYSFLMDNKPKSVLPTGWVDRQMEQQETPPVAADEIAQPATEEVKDYSQPPQVGLPSVGYYGFKAGQPTEMDDYQKQPTVEEHLQNAPPIVNSFEDEAGAFDEHDEFHAQMTALEEAEIQAEHELQRSMKPITPLDSMDDLLDQAREQGMQVEEAQLEMDYLAMDAQSRKNVCRFFKLRVVPAYVKGEQHLIHIAKGKRREIIIKRVDEVDYNTHETEAHKTTVFANWDEEARNVQIAKSAMKAATDTPAWSEKYFLEQLEAKLAEDGQADADVVLGDLVADRQVIEIEGIVTSRTATSDHQSEVINEMMERGVEQAGMLVDNAVVKYHRFESSCLVLNEENKQLIEAVVNKETATEVIEQLGIFKRDCTLPLREIARLTQIFTKQVNRYLLTELASGWSVDDAIEDFKDLQNTVVRQYGAEQTEEELNAMLDRIYRGAAQYTFSTGMVEGSEAIGHTTVFTLLPFYYSQYPIAFSDNAGAILKADHPELYELLNKLNGEGVSAEVKLVTLDNVVLTFLRSLGDDGLYFLVDINN